MAAAILFACAGVVVAQPDEPDGDAGEDLVEAAASSLDAGDVIPNRFIVVLADDADPAAAASELAGALNSDIEVTHTYENALKGFAIRAQDLSLSELRSAASGVTGVEFAARDRVVEATAQRRPTGVNRVDADQSSTAAGNGKGRVNADVAILDSGIYKKHDDLNVSGGYNCTGRDKSAYSDGDGHGTHVAGSAAAKDNGFGVVGVAPGARLLAVKVLGSDGSGSFSSVICGIDWVTGKNKDGDTANDVEVANMSLGAIVPGTDDGNCGWTGDNASAAMHRAVCNSVDAGVFYAVAAGNDSVDFATTVPAAFDQVLTVTAMTDYNGNPSRKEFSSCSNDVGETAADFSNFTTPETHVTSDAEHTIAAPGVCIRSTWNNGKYKSISGTSMASPHVAGTAALCLVSGKCPRNNPGGTLDKLRSDAAAQPASYGYDEDPDSAGAVRYYGYLEYAGGY